MSPHTLRFLCVLILCPAIAVGLGWVWDQLDWSGIGAAGGMLVIYFALCFPLVRSLRL